MCMRKDTDTDMGIGMGTGMCMGMGMRYVCPLCVVRVVCIYTCIDHTRAYIYMYIYICILTRACRTKVHAAGPQCEVQDLQELDSSKVLVRRGGDS